MSLKYEPASAPLHISVKWLFRAGGCWQQVSPYRRTRETLEAMLTAFMDDGSV